MKIEEGKYYLTSAGVKIGPAKRDSEFVYYRLWSDKHKVSFGFTPDGEFRGNLQSYPEMGYIIPYTEDMIQEGKYYLSSHGTVYGPAIKFPGGDNFIMYAESIGCGHLFSPDGQCVSNPAHSIVGVADAYYDNNGVDAFALAMKEKLEKKRSEGRYGWHDKNVCSVSDLNAMLLDHIRKGDPVDVANFCMMLHQRGEKIHLNI